MSRTYSIGCKDCLESLWIGQGRQTGKKYIYTHNMEVMEALEKFLFAHLGHNLIFVDDGDIFGGEGEDFHANEYLAKIANG